VAAKTLSVSTSLLGRIPKRRNLSGLLNVCAAILGMTTLLLMVQISGVASKAYEVQRLEDSRTYWQETNYRVEAEIARLQSLNRIEAEAVNRLKMVPAKNVISVLVAKPRESNAVAQPANREAPSAATSSNAKSRAWHQDLLEIVEQLWERR